MYTIISSTNNDSFVFSFAVWMPFISFSCLIPFARTSNTILNRSGESWHPCLVPHLSGKIFSFCPLSMMLAVGFPYVAFIMLQNAPSASALLNVFILNGCCTLSNVFSASIDTTPAHYSDGGGSLWWGKQNVPAPTGTLHSGLSVLCQCDGDPVTRASALWTAAQDMCHLLSIISVWCLGGRG